MPLPAGRFDLAQEGFPVRWEHPADAEQQWIQEASVYPLPITPMSFSFIAEAFTPGQSQAVGRYGYPGTLRCLRINTYYYRARDLGEIAPEDLEDLKDLKARYYTYEDRLEEAMPHVWDWWVRDLLPEMQEHLAYWEGFDLHAGSPSVLAEHLEETCRRARRFSEIEAYASLPRGLAMSMFEELYQELFGTDARWEAWDLVRGFDNKTLETDRALWHLSRAALATPEVQKLLEQEKAEDALQTLQVHATPRASCATFSPTYTPSSPSMASAIIRSGNLRSQVGLRTRLRYWPNCAAFSHSLTATRIRGAVRSKLNACD
jgi:hypothetical protein